MICFPAAGPGLETFLGGMETCLRNRPYCGACPLETFLGGMETEGWAGSGDRVPFLETFLGGMETQMGDKNGAVAGGP